MFCSAFGAATPNHQADIVETSKGPLKITPLFHGSVMLEFDGKIIHIDPWSQADYTGIPKADLIVITHTHADHMDAALLKTLRKESTILVGPPAVTDTLNGTVGDTDAISNGEKKTFLGIEIEAVPMYNLKLGSGPGKPFHHKGIGNGYILTFGDYPSLFFRRHGMRPGDEGAEEHLGRVRGDESAAHYAARRSGRVRCSVPAQDRVPLSLSRPEYAGICRRTKEHAGSRSASSKIGRGAVSHGY